MPSAPHREHLGSFVPLTAHDLSRLAANSETRLLYLEYLTYIHDLVCELSDHPVYSRFTDEQDVKIDTGLIVQRSFGGEDTLSKNVQNNLESAFDLRSSGRVKREFAAVQGLRREVSSFISGLLFTYNQVRGLA